MPDYIITKGATSVIIEVFIGDATQAFLGKGGLTSASVTCAYSRTDQGNAAATAITLAAGTKGTYVNSGAAGTGGGFVEKDATAAKGIYEFSVPTAVLATGVNDVIITFVDAGTNNLILAPIHIMLTTFDLQTATQKVDVDTIKTNAVAASGGTITFPNGTLASTTNITAGTIATVTTLTQLTTAATESYAADGATATPLQLLYMIWSFLAEKNVSSTTLTAKKLDGSTTSMTFTLNDATNPTSITRAT